MTVGKLVRELRVGAGAAWRVWRKARRQHRSFAEQLAHEVDLLRAEVRRLERLYAVELGYVPSVALRDRVVDMQEELG